jgi:hypothetical protein
MVKIREVFELDKEGWEYVPYKSSTKIGRLFVTHDTGQAGQYAHYRAQSAFEDNVVLGHTHRIGYSITGNAAGQPHVAAMFGWLGDFDAVDYLAQINARRGWAHGFGVGVMEKDGTIHLQPVPIVKGACVVAGELIR